jgi:8-oxo-dGTP pyrophosphatase MutT (NUDIX family)
VFVGGAWVFPGGRVDEADRDPRWQDYCDGLTEQCANQRLGIAQHGLAFWVAAIREAFEEAGLLYRDSNNPVDGPAMASPAPDQLLRWRTELLAGTLDWLELTSSQGWQLQAPKLHYLSHWVTPLGPPRRFDTRFFLALAPAGQDASHDNHEAVATQWITPQAALALHDTGQLALIFPTIMTLRALSGFTDCATLLQRVLPT